METYNEVIELVEQVLVGDSKLSAKYTKAESARQRKRLNVVQKLIVKAKRDLITEDKKDR